MPASKADTESLLTKASIYSKTPTMVNEGSKEHKHQPSSLERQALSEKKVTDYRIPLAIAYLFLFVASIAYLAVGGISDYYKHSMYFGAIAAGHTVFFAFSLLIISSGKIYTNSLPPSASLAARVISAFLAFAWIIVPALTLGYGVGDSDIERLELALSFATLLGCIVAAILQHKQHSWYMTRWRSTNRSGSV